MEPEELAKRRVCGAHFEPRMFCDPKVPNEGLKPNAMPTLHLPNQLTDDNDDRDKEEEFLDDFQDLEILELEKEISDMFASTNKALCVEGNSSTNKVFNESNESCSFFKNKFIKWQETLAMKYEEHKYRQKFKLFCLNLYCNAPKAYKLFKKCFSLPGLRSLQNTKLILPSGVNESFINLLSKHLAKMPEEAKYVTLCIDEMPLRKSLYYDIRNDKIVGYHNFNENEDVQLSENALVLRIKGCFLDYEQLIAYGTTGNDYDLKLIPDWIEHTIKILFEHNFVVCAIVANRSKHMTQFALIYSISIEKPYLTIENKKIFFIFDIPHLLISIRNILLESDLLYDGVMASWEHVKSFYKKDTKRKIRLSPKLTYAHIKPARTMRMKAKLMKQVFSYSVAAAMSADVDAGHQPAEATGTAKFLAEMNNLYDIFNPNHVNQDKKSSTEIRQLQRNIISYAYSLFLNMKAVNRSTGEEQDAALRCFFALVISLRAIEELHVFLDQGGMNESLNRRLHLNYEDFVSDFNGIYKETLTPIQFRRRFSKVALEHIMKNAELMKSQSKSNIDSMIFGKESVKNDLTLLAKYFPNPPKSSSLAIGTTDYRFTMPSVATFEFVSSYLLYKCSTRHKKCDIFEKYVRKNRSLIADDQINRVTKTSLRLVVPPEDFIDYFCECEKRFVEKFDATTLPLQSNVAGRLLVSLKAIPPITPCPCFPLDFLLKLFLRLRIYHTIKFRNINLKRSHFLDTEKDYMIE